MWKSAALYLVALSAIARCVWVLAALLPLTRDDTVSSGVFWTLLVAVSVLSHAMLALAMRSALRGDA